MEEGYVFNRQISLHVVRKGTEKQAVVVSAPVRGGALTNTMVERAKEPELFKLVSRIADGKGLDVDVPEALWDRIREIGLVVAREQLSSAVDFACWLDDAPGPKLRSRRGLVVDPSYRVTPTSGLREEHHDLVVGNYWCLRVAAAADPFRKGPWLWVDDPSYPAPSAFSVRPAQEEALAALRPGEAPPAGFDADLLAHLVRAGVCDTEAGRAARRARQARRIRGWKGSFLDDGYATLRGIVHPQNLRAIRRYYKALVGEGRVRFGDKQVPRRFVAHNEPVARWLLLRLAPLVSRVVGSPMQPSYVYFASYRPGAVLERHTDREQCQVSITLLLDYEPEPASVSPWPLYLQAEGGEPTRVDLGLGDGLIYRGTELTHWRDVLADGQSSTGLFLHYVPADYKGSLD